MSFYCLTDSDQNNWLDDPELFLYAKGPDDVHLWRCKKPASSSSSSSLVVPMKSDDFDYVSNVKNHEELIGYLFDWDETDYNRLVNYIYEKRLLVNSQGFVIAELLHKADKDANKTINDANEEDVPAIYIRSLDVLRLKPYIPDLTEPPIPLRMVKYLGDVNGEAAMMEEDSNVTKFTARVADLESKNKTLDTTVTKLTANVAKLTLDLAARINTVADLESKNKTLQNKVTESTTVLATRTNKLATSQQELNRVKNAYKEAWMNDLTNGDWVGVGGLKVFGSLVYSLTILGNQGTFIVDDSSTNVRARYWYKIKLSSTSKWEYKAISFEDLTPNKEKSRFSQGIWSSFKSEDGKTYVYRE